MEKHSLAACSVQQHHVVPLLRSLECVPETRLLSANLSALSCAHGSGNIDIACRQHRHGLSVYMYLSSCAATFVQAEAHRNNSL